MQYGGKRRNKTAKSLVLFLGCLMIFGLVSAYGQDDDFDFGDDDFSDDDFADFGDMFGDADSEFVSVASDDEGPVDIPEGEGNVVGQVFNAETGDTVPGVTVILQWPDAVADQEANLQPREEVSVSDKDGQFRFTDVPSGVYDLRFVKPGFRNATLKGFKLFPNTANRADFPLPPKPADFAGDIFDMGEFEITAEALGDSRAMLDDFRQESAGSIDFLSSEDFSKYASTDVSDVINRLPGVTVVEGKFAVVRGLGDRYNSTQVNQLPITSPDPLRQGLQLDLFPTSIIDNVISNKTFLPYDPSNSSGAAFNLNTKPMPDEFEGSFKVGFRFNTQALDHFLTDPRRPATYPNPFAFNTQNNNRPVFIQPVDTTSEQAARDQLSKDPPSIVGRNLSNPMGITFGVNLGDTVEVFNRNLGIIASFSYDTDFTTDIGTQQDKFYLTNLPQQTPPPGFSNSRFNPDAGRRFSTGFLPGGYFRGELEGGNLEYDFNNSVAETQFAGLTGLSLDLDKEGTNKVSFVALGSFNSVDQVVRRSNGQVVAPYDTDLTTTVTLVRNGRSVDANEPRFGGFADAFPFVGLPPDPNGDGSVYMNQDIVSYEERKLGALQVFSEHLVQPLDDLQLNFGYTHVYTSSYLPGQSVFWYLQNAETGEYSVPDSLELGFQPVLVTWREITETLDGFRADAENEWALDSDHDVGFRLGYAWNEASRRTDQQEQFADSAGFSSTSRDENAELQTQNGELTSTSTFSFANTYRRIEAGHLTANFRAGPLEITGGFRYEDINISAQGDTTIPGIGTVGNISLQSILDEVPNATPGSTLPPGEFNQTNGQIIGFTDATAPGLIKQTNILPGITFNYEAFEDFNIRGGTNITYAQPSFRELSPIFTLDPFTGDLTLGNPNLQLSRVSSFDLSFEYRFENGAYISFGGFYKEIDQPIEQIRLSSTLANTSFLTFFNNPGTARLRGLEVEARTDLAFLGNELENFSVGFNGAYIDASVDYPESVYRSYFFIQTVTPSGEITNVQGTGVGPDSTADQPYGNHKPDSRRLFDQPEWIVNADLSYENPDWGTILTLAVFAQSDVLTSVGSGFDASADEFSLAYYQLDVILQQNLGFIDSSLENFTFGVALKNITNTERGIKYDGDPLELSLPRITYREGVGIRFSVTATF